MRQYEQRASEYERVAEERDKARAVYEGLRKQRCACSRCVRALHLRLLESMTAARHPMRSWFGVWSRIVLSTRPSIFDCSCLRFTRFCWSPRLLGVTLAPAVLEPISMFSLATSGYQLLLGLRPLTLLCLALFCAY